MSSVVEQLTEVTPAEARAAKAEAVMRAAGLEPLEPYPGTMRPWLCRCSRCGKTVSPLHNSVQQGQGGCSDCGRIKQGQNRKAAAAADAEAVMRAAGLEPLEPYPGSAKPWRCRCVECGEVVNPRHNNVLVRGRGCNPCGRHRVSEDMRLETTSAKLMMRAAGFAPLEPYPGSGSPWRCRCVECGEVVTPRYNAVQQGRGGCQVCRPRGFIGTRTGYLYLLKSEPFRAYKIGITTQPKRRITEHRVSPRQEWELCLLLRFADGFTARSLEQKVITTWRAAGWAEAVPADLMPQGGFTETVAMLDAGPVSAVLDQLGAALAD